MQVAEPVPLLSELEAALCEVVADEQLDPEADLRESGEQGEGTRRDVVQRQHPDEECRSEGQEDQQRRHLTTMKTMARTAAPEAMAST